MKTTFLSLLLGVFLLTAHAAPIIEIDRIVAIVNKNVITERQLQSRMAQVKNTLKAQKILSPADDVLARQVLEQMITEEIELQFAANNAISLDADEVNQTIQNLAQQNHTNVAGLRAKLAQNGESYEQFRETMERELLLAKVKEREVDARISVSDTEVDQVLKSAQYANNAEYHLASILVSVPERADSKMLDALASKANKALSELNNKRPFGNVAASYSDAPNALKGGDLGWRSAASFPPDFTALLEQLQPGQHTGLVRTQQGFFIFQLQAKRTGKAPVIVNQYRTRHILVRSNEVVSDNEAKAKIMQIRERLLHGADFTEMAKLHSEDSSNSKGGELGWLSQGDTVAEFENALLSLPLHTLSEPVRSPFGWHLILLDGKRTQDVSADRERLQLRQQIHARKAEQAYIDWLHQLRDSAYVEIHLDDK